MTSPRQHMGAVTWLLMWIPLLVMAAAVSLEPFRVGMAILMLNRPRPLLHLLTFLAGGFAMGLTVGVTVLFVLRPVLRSAHFTLPRVQLVVGALVLALAAVVYASAATGLGRPSPDREPGRFEARIRLMAGNHSPWTSGVAGLGIALPSVDYLAALTLIVASGAAASTQFGALLLFNVVAFGLVEMPLISYLVAPDRTRDALAVLHNWLRTERRRRVATLMAIVGAVLLLAGFAGL